MVSFVVYPQSFSYPAPAVVVTLSVGVPVEHTYHSRREVKTDEAAEENVFVRKFFVVIPQVGKNSVIAAVGQSVEVMDDAFRIGRIQEKPVRQTVDEGIGLQAAGNRQFRQFLDYPHRQVDGFIQMGIPLPDIFQIAGKTLPFS